MHGARDRAQDFLKDLKRKNTAPGCCKHLVGRVRPLSNAEEEDDQLGLKNLFRRGSGRPRIAVAAIFKNEGPYVLEWVAHYRLLGFDRIVIADNNSTDETTDILKKLDAAGIVTHLPFPGEPGKPPQIWSYLRMFLDHGKSVDWMVFVDADEFIEPVPGTPALSDWLTTLPADVGAVALNWKVHGSAGRREPGEGLVQERFPTRARDERGINAIFKSICRCTAFKDPVNPHLFNLKPGFRYVDSAGNDLVQTEKPGVAVKPVFGSFFVRHYIIKSEEEFRTRKAPRGFADKLDAARDMEFFKAVDHNELSDPVDPRWVARVKEEIGQLQSRISRP